LTSSSVAVGSNELSFLVFFFLNILRRYGVCFLSE
jgi:hypothetical protein